MKLWQLIVTGLVVHVILFYSIFDVYFTSPLVHGMTSYSSTLPPPAKRLVLFVADGLRADKFYELEKDGKTIAPYLRNIIETRGSWGVSHTRVPTETRPGHVALIAGFYEDVSAVAKGWKENPVNFDSVFNESRYTWAWGSPDVLPMFSKGASGDHVFINCYSAEWVDFGGHDSTRLDTWVFDKVTEFFAKSKLDKPLHDKLHQNKIVFFLHLLGIDTNGHSHKPYSQAYLQNVEHVDKGVKMMEELIEDYYDDDGQTAYVLTSDHGMTDWGSHGAGDPSETLTPLVAWGAGIQLPVHEQTCGHYTDNFCKDWKLNHLLRNDVEQADIAPLMTYLIGAPFPMNSVGTLPKDYLDISDWQKAEALYTNALQMLAQYEVKMNQVKESSISVTFRPYKELTPTKTFDALKNLRSLMKNGLYQQAIKEGDLLIKITLEGLNYYQTYNRLFLGASIVSGFLGWMAFILQLALQENSTIKLNTGSYLQQTTLFIILGLLVLTVLLVQHSPWTYYLYCLLPVILWSKATKGLKFVMHHLNAIKGRKEILTLSLSIFITLLGLQILVLGFFYRELLSIGLVGMALWPFFNSSITFNKISVIGWCVSCLLVAVFPLLPLVGRNSNIAVVMVSGLAEFMLGVVIVWWEHKRYKRNRINWILIIECIFILVATCVVYITKSSIKSGNGLPLYCQIFSWLLLVICPCLPLVSENSLEERLTSVGLSFLALYQLMCITFEGFFLLSLSMLLYFWLKMEHESLNNNQKKILNQIQFNNTNFISHHNSTACRSLELADLRRAFFYIFLIVVGFFGTGNIASMNSFDPASIYCFVTVFKPATMGTLMMIKNLIPLLVVTCVFRGVHVITKIPTRTLFLLVLLMCDFMGLHFYFLVKDTGSWLDIGTSISHYVIVMSLIIFLMLLFAVSQILTTFKFKIFFKPSHHEAKLTN
ncbi:GPI ethanolamine phosphate transferase 1 [Patella vulgata]|uniref:GPI ethanolamine phosphate transferase 1 n=1 Tax=Patella vulgata TaxID=6465 RepID=UPI00217F7ED7|nr:GPI ethanolamine phosphate transferase 1 [Patella vulgata]XP_050397516.1 GPI ethanolamine phosphate transferase 1 [Patella vulgata]